MDRWYEIDSNKNFEDIVSEIKNDIENYVFPWFKQVNNQNELVNQYKTEQDIYLIIKGLDSYLALHAMRENRLKEAEELFKSQINKLSHNSDAQDRIKELAKENGIIIK